MALYLPYCSTDSGVDAGAWRRFREMCFRGVLRAISISDKIRHGTEFSLHLKYSTADTEQPHVVFTGDVSIQAGADALANGPSCRAPGRRGTVMPSMAQAESLGLKQNLVRGVDPARSTVLGWRSGRLRPDGRRPPSVGHEPALAVGNGHGVHAAHRRRASARETCWRRSECAPCRDWWRPMVLKVRVGQDDVGVHNFAEGHQAQLDQRLEAVAHPAHQAVPPVQQVQ